MEELNSLSLKELFERWLAKPSPDVENVLYKKCKFLLLKARRRWPKISNEDFEELMQDTILEVFNHLKKKGVEDHPEALLCLVLTHNCIDHQRIIHPEIIHEADLENLIGTNLEQAQTRNPETEYELKERKEIIMKIIRKFPPAQRMCVQLKLEGFDNEEIRQILQKRIGKCYSVKDLLFIALKKLRRELNGI